MDNNIPLNDPGLKSEPNNHVFPKPLLDKQHRIFNTVGYKNRVLEDDLMKDIESLIKYGNSVFENCDSITDLTEIESIKEDNPNPVLASHFVQMNDISEEFYMTFKPHNGLSSLRRGFYKLLPIPNKVPVINLSTWKTQVLFNEGPTNNITYKHDCHVGPLVNRYAVSRNLRTKRYLKLPNNDQNQKEFLQRIQGKTIYVSSAEMIKDEASVYHMKEVLWFVW